MTYFTDIITCTSMKLLMSMASPSFWLTAFLSFKLLDLNDFHTEAPRFFFSLTFNTCALDVGTRIDKSTMHDRREKGLNSERNGTSGIITVSLKNELISYGLYFLSRMYHKHLRIPSRSLSPKQVG